MDISMKKASSINLYPSEDDLAQLLIDVVDSFKWTDLTVLYEAPIYSKRIGKFLEYRNDKSTNIAVQPIDVSKESDFHKILHKVNDMDHTNVNIIIESSVEHLKDILDQVKQFILFQNFN